MSYQVLARKYRPQLFEDVVAQEHVTRTLRNAVSNDRVGSGYLFSGPRGTGKTTTARILAKALNCVNGPTATPCGECSTCTEIAAGSSLDVLEIDAASNTGVDDIRTLRENVRYLPTGGKKRIYIIDEVHRLSGAAFDALLKTLEEPPAHVVFIFATTEPLKVPETILSRTQRFDFRRVSTADLTDHLRKIAQLEGLEVDENALQLLARKADGSVRDSLSLLDQVAAFADALITEQIVVEALGLVDRQVLFDFTEAVAARESRRVLELTGTILDAGVDVADFVQELLEHFRILLVLAVDKNAADLLRLPDDEIAAYNRQAENFSVGDLVRLMKAAADLNFDLKSGLDERLVLELAGVKMAEMEATVQFADILERLQQDSPSLMPGNDLFGTKKKSDKSSRQSVESGDDWSTATATPRLSRTVNLAQLNAGWDAFLGLLRQKSQMLASQLGMADIRQVSDNEVELVFGPAGAASKQVVERPENKRLITQMLQQHFRAGLRLRFSMDEAAEPVKGDNGRKNSNSNEVARIVADSPRLKRLLEKVDGDIIGIKKVDE